MPGRIGSWDNSIYPLVIKRCNWKSHVNEGFSGKITKHRTNCGVLVPEAIPKAKYQPVPTRICKSTTIMRWVSPFLWSNSEAQTEDRRRFVHQIVGRISGFSQWINDDELWLSWSIFGSPTNASFAGYGCGSGSIKKAHKATGLASTFPVAWRMD